MRTPRSTSSGLRLAGAGRRRALLGLSVAAAVLATTVPLTAAAAARPKPAGHVYVGRTGSGQDGTGTGWFNNQPGLDPAAVAAGGMTVAWRAKVAGQTYASPVQVGSTIVVATEDAHVYGFDLGTGKQLWDTTLGKPWAVGNLRSTGGQTCPDLQPTIGVTSTPVADPDGRSVYLEAKTADPRDTRHAVNTVFSVDPRTGKVQWRTAVGGHAQNQPSAVFRNDTELQRTGLLLLGGRVYLAFGAHCDFGPYRGWIAGIDVGTHRQTALWTDTDRDGVQADATGGGGIWQGGAALTSDGNGRIFVVVGNGPTPGFRGPAGAELGESVIRLQVQRDGTLAVSDTFTPAIADYLNTADSDLGSSGATLLPTSMGSGDAPHVAAVFDKESRLFIVNRDQLGGRTAGDVNAEALGPFTYGAKGQIAAYGGEGGYVYYADNSGLRAFSRTGVTLGGLPAYSMTGLTGAGAGVGYAHAQGAPVVTSNGSQPGTGIVWFVARAEHAGKLGHLVAASPVPVGGVLPVLWRGPEFSGTKLARPLVANGLVIVPQQNGQLTAYKEAKPRAGGNFRPQVADLGNVAIGATATVEIDLFPRTGRRGGNSGVTSTNPAFTLQRTHGDVVRITFKPTTVGTTTGQLIAKTSAGVERFGLEGVGLAAGTAAVRLIPVGGLTLGPTVVGQSDSGQVTLSNDSETAVKVTAAQVTGPYAIPVLKQVQTVPEEGQLLILVTFAPTARGDNAGTLTVTTNQGTLSIPLQGQGSGPGVLTLSAPSLDFGTVRVGAATTLTLTVSNTGEGVLHLDKAKEPSGNFTDPAPIFEGTTLAPGQVLVQKIVFKPTGNSGPRGSAYTLTGDGGQGVQTVTLTGQAQR